MFTFDTAKLEWVNPPKTFEISEDRVEMTTLPDTDMWQNTYYGFAHNNGHMLVMETAEPTFSFYVRAELFGTALFDQCGVIVYQDESCWMKGNLERENERYSNLNSVVTNHAFSDFATAPVDPATTVLYHRLSRRRADFQLAISTDGETYYPQRMFHLAKAEGAIRFGLYACSPAKQGGCRAVFTEMRIEPCVWPAWQG